MPNSIRDVMTKNPITLNIDATVDEAARAMRDNDIGDIIVLDGKKPAGILTDRDIVIRAIAERKDPKKARVGEFCSREVATIRPDDPIDKAVQMMRERTIRRLPVTDNGQIIGIVSLGDLALERDRQSVLGEISEAPPNR